MQICTLKNGGWGNRVHVSLVICVFSELLRPLWASQSDRLIRKKRTKTRWVCFLSLWGALAASGLDCRPAAAGRRRPRWPAAGCYPPAASGRQCRRPATGDWPPAGVADGSSAAGSGSGHLRPQCRLTVPPVCAVGPVVAAVALQARETFHRGRSITI